MGRATRRSLSTAMASSRSVIAVLRSVSLAATRNEVMEADIQQVRRPRKMIRSMTRPSTASSSRTPAATESTCRRSPNSRTRLRTACVSCGARATSVSANQRAVGLLADRQTGGISTTRASSRNTSSRSSSARARRRSGTTCCAWWTRTRPTATGTVMSRRGLSPRCAACSRITS